MKDNKDIVIGTVVMVAVVALMVFFIGKSASGPSGGASGGSLTANLSTISASDWQQGGGSTAKATLIEYADFQCPACASYYSVVKQLTQDFGDSLRVVYRYFPLQQHQYGRLAAYAAEAAGKQGKFWEMHDMLFGNQSDWADSSDAESIFIGYATTLGLNVDQFKTDLHSDSVAARVQSDYEGGFTAGVDSTPTFYLNGKKLANPATYNEFKSLISDAIGKNQ